MIQCVLLKVLNKMLEKTNILTKTQFQNLNCSKMFFFFQVFQKVFKLYETKFVS